MDQTVADEYKSSLNDLNFNSKPLINMLTMLADENKKHASTIVKTIMTHIDSAPPESKLPCLYLIDSIMKNLGDAYMKIFCQQIVGIFTSVFEKVDENTRSLMFKLRQTWTDIVPNKILYNLDVSVKQLDPAWPVTAKHPSKKILINPKFIGAAADEKKVSEANANSPTSLKKEEDQIKQKQGEVLKQLLAKQEQLRQLEFQKLQMSMKKKNTTIGSNVPAPSSFKKNNRDPRMVKINVSQNSSVIKPCSNRVVQDKPVASKLEVCTPNTKNIASTTKLQTGSVLNMNVVELSGKPSDQQPIQPRKVSPKSKNVMNKGKQTPVSSNKVDEELKCSVSENIGTSSKTDKAYVKTDAIPVKLQEKNPKDIFKSFKMTPKKKNASDSTKITHITMNTPVIKKKISQMKIPKKTEKQNSSLKSDSLNNADKKVIAKDEREQITSSSDCGNLEMKNKSMKLNNIANKSKSFKTNEPHEIVSNLDLIANKDEDLRIKPMSLKDDTTNVRMPKRDILESNSLSVEVDELHPPRKKIRSDDVENQSPDNRSNTPVLFGSEDQDLRQTAFSDINSKDWSQYKANHPDEYSPSPGRQDSFDGKFRSRKYHFSQKYYHNSSDYDRYGPSRPSRGRYSNRHNSYRKYFPRGMRGRSPYNPRLAVMLDSQAILQQAEEKFRSGRISETEYTDLCHDLQKMTENNEYRFFNNYLPQKQNVEDPIQIPESQIPRKDNKSKEMVSSNVEHGLFDDCRIGLNYSPEKPNVEDPVQISESQIPRKENKSKEMASSNVEHGLYDDCRIGLDYSPEKPNEESQIPENQILRKETEPEKIASDNIRIQKASMYPPDLKTFFLDGKERMLHFVDDKAIVIMDNNEPHELTFKDELKKIYIEGMAEPLTLGFDGKTAEFKLNNQRHAVRFGVPGRELYINNHPYEARFGGPPVLVMLEDGQIYKMHLSGPAPQVVIGDQPQFELLAKHRNNVNNTSQALDPHTEYGTPPDCFKDVDMRVKPDSVSQCDVIVNESCPFFREDTKDIDWRQIPPTSSLKELENNPINMFKENVGTTYETWINEDNVNSISFQDTNNEVKQSVPKEPLSYKWDMPMHQQHPLTHLQQERQHPSEHLHLKRPYPSEQTQPEMHLPEHMQKQRQHPPEHMLHQRHHPPDHMQQQRQYSPEHMRQDPPEHMRQDPPEHMRQDPPEHMRQDPPEHMRQDLPEHMRQDPPEHMRQDPPEHMRQDPPEHMRQDPPEHMLQHPSAQIQSHHHSSAHIHQPQQSLMHMQQHEQHSEKVLPSSASQKWTYKRDNTYWQSDNYRKNYQASNLHEDNRAYKATRHFEDDDKYYDPHPHHSRGSYVQRSVFHGRHPRGRFPGPRYRPGVFNADFSRPRQYPPLRDQPNARFPAAPQKPLLPPPFPPAFLRTSDTRDVAAGAYSGTHNGQTRAGLLPTPSPSSKIQPAELNPPEMKVDVESLLEKLVAAGIINTKMYEESEPEPEPEVSTTEKCDDDDQETEESSEEIPDIELTTESLRMHRPTVISALHKGLQCATCGMRFKEMQNDMYSRHLDWHFRMNRREKDTKRAISRTWYFEIEDWLQFEEFEDFEERTPSYFELLAEDTQPEVVEVPAVISVSATNDDQECCPVCLEKFQLFWVEDEEEWHFRNAVRHDNVTYHPACYEDFIKTCEAEKALKGLENTAHDLEEIDEEIIDVLNDTIEHVCCTMDIIEEVPIESSVEVPPVEDHSEEEILEGKPGEEEIIGLISESDLEIDSDTPKAESKMVVMQSGGITLKVKAESLQCHSPSNSSEKDTKVGDDKQLDDDDEIEFRPPTPDPNFEVQPMVSKGRELSGLCCIM